MWKVLFLDLPHMGIVLSIKTLYYILLFLVCNVTHNPVAVSFDLTSMTSSDVYKLVVWYNQDYGIFPTHLLGARCDKIMHWSTTPIFHTVLQHYCLPNVYMKNP